jgi:hypothetical protein
MDNFSLTLEASPESLRLLSKLIKLMIDAKKYDNNQAESSPESERLKEIEELLDKPIQREH